MPEGHSIHRLARDLRELLGVPVAATSPQGKFASGAAELDGGTPVAAEAYGKHLLIRFDGRPALHVHLGMQGKLLRFPAPAGPAPRQVRLRLHGPPAAWDLIAPSAASCWTRRAPRRCWPGSDPTRCARTPTASWPWPTSPRHPSRSGSPWSTSAWSPGSATSSGPRRCARPGSTPAASPRTWSPASWTGSGTCWSR
jgi:hypothetical protein